MNCAAARGRLTAVIHLIHLTKRYRSATAVNDLTLTCHPGTVTGFLGPHGPGSQPHSEC